MIKICDICDNYFEAMRSDTLCCSKICSGRKYYFKKVGFVNKISGLSLYESYNKRWELKSKKKISFDKIEVFNELEIYLKKLKSKRYYVDAVEIYKLIDMYDKVYPGRKGLPHMNVLSGNHEKCFNAMLVGLFKFYNLHK